MYCPQVLSVSVHLPWSGSACDMAPGTTQGGSQVAQEINQLDLYRGQYRYFGHIFIRDYRSRDLGFDFRVGLNCVLKFSDFVS